MFNKGVSYEVLSTVQLFFKQNTNLMISFIQLLHKSSLSFKSSSASCCTQS